MAAGKAYHHVSADLEYPRVADRRWIGTWKASQGVLVWLLAILQVCWHCLAGRENCFQQSDKFAGHVGEGLLLHSIGL